MLRAEAFEQDIEQYRPRGRRRPRRASRQQRRNPCSKPFAPSPRAAASPSTNYPRITTKAASSSSCIWRWTKRSNLRDAHGQATDLEEDIHRETDPNALVNIHIEPLERHSAGAEDMKVLARSVQDYLNSLQAEYHELADCHDVHVRSVDHKILVSCHCSMDGGLPVTEVHDFTAAVEDRVKERFPQIYRLTIHPEPVGEG